MSHQYYNPATTRLQRSELAVPGSSPKMFEKALNSNADYIFLDLEDAVSPNDKLSARENIIRALNEINWRERGKTISVRINSLDTHYMYRDVVDIMEHVGDKVDTILVPKVGTDSDVYMVDCLLTQIENKKKFNFDHIKLNSTNLLNFISSLRNSIKSDISEIKEKKILSLSKKTCNIIVKKRYSFQ